MRTMHGLLPHALCSFLLLASIEDVSAIDGIHWWGEVPDIEYAIWPPYCKAKASTFYRRSQGTGLVSKREEERWKRYFGDNWHHVHHYCRALQWQFRAAHTGFLANHPEPESYLSAIARDINYTWSRMQHPHPIYGKMGTDLLLAYQDAGNPNKARNVMQTLLKLKPHNRFTYTGAAEYYRKQDDLTKAIEILELGAGKVKKNKKILADLAQDYFDLKQYEKSRQYASLARSKGMKLVRLGRELKEVGFPISDK